MVLLRGGGGSLWLRTFTQYLALVLGSVTDRSNYINTVNLYLLFIYSHPGSFPKGFKVVTELLYNALPEYRQQSPNLSHILHRPVTTCTGSCVSESRKNPPYCLTQAHHLSPITHPPHSLSLSMNHTQPGSLPHHSTTPTPSQVGTHRLKRSSLCQCLTTTLPKLEHM